MTTKTIQVTVEAMVVAPEGYHEDVLDAGLERISGIVLDDGTSIVYAERKETT